MDKTRAEYCLLKKFVNLKSEEDPCSVKNVTLKTATANHAESKTEKISSALIFLFMKEEIYLP